MKTPKLDLSIAEKAGLKKAGIRINQITGYAEDELSEILNTSGLRAKQVLASARFQQLPSVGPMAAKDLINMGYYSLAQLKNKTGPELLDEHEQWLGAWTDPCVEDQFRLIVHHANHPNRTKQWWDFTAERKAYRAQHGYPDNRPTKAWMELEKYQ